MLRNIKKLVKSYKLPIILAVLLLPAVFTNTAKAATSEIVCPDGAVITYEVGDQAPSIDIVCKDHIPASGTNSKGDCTGDDLNESNCGIVYYINVFINILSAIVGIVVTGVIIWGGIIYSTSKGDPGKISEGKKKIMNGITSLALFVFSYAFLQWVVPGGLF